MSANELQFELQRGAKLVIFYYCVSLLIVSFRRASPIYLVKAGENAAVKGLPWTALTLAAGWWGIPWGPIYSIQSLIVNFKGGKEVQVQPQPMSQAAKA
jgi:hypothetical protein